MSSSIAFLALTLSSLAMRSSSSSSNVNFLFVPAAVSDSPGFVEASSGRRLAASARPAWVVSKSRTARSRSSSSSRAFIRAISFSASWRSFSARLSSFFWATRLARAHSRQKMSPRWHATGSLAISRHRQQEPKGRKESRFRRAELVPQWDLANARSCEVKTGRDVFRLPAAQRRNRQHFCPGYSFSRKTEYGMVRKTYCVTFLRLVLGKRKSRSQMGPLRPGYVK